jgi:hypothetical protein
MCPSVFRYNWFEVDNLNDGIPSGNPYIEVKSAVPVIDEHVRGGIHLKFNFQPHVSYSS